MSHAANDSVVIKNIYYMMAYAFRSLDIDEYKQLQTEPFENMMDLFAAIIALGLSSQRRRGFDRSYLEKSENTTQVRGHIETQATMRLVAKHSLKVACVFDEYSENTYLNQILKTTALYLIRSSEVSGLRKEEIKSILLYMRDIDSIAPRDIEWTRLIYHRNNRSYRMLMNVCYMVLHSMIIKEENGETSLAEFKDDQQFHRLYEHFILEYYRKHHPELKPNAQTITSGIGEDAPSFLPQLITDVTLTYGTRKLIVDAKLYGHILSMHFEKEIMSAANRNQIFSYVMHASEGFDGEVSGMLLYAQTANESEQKTSWNEVGHRFSLYTLNLNRDFQSISAELEEIADLLVCG